MTFGGRSICCWCLMFPLFLTSVRTADRFKMDSSNTEAWINPDDAFAPIRVSKPDSGDMSNKAIEECQKSLEEWIEKHSACEQDCQIQSSNDQTENKELLLKMSVNNPPEQCKEDKNGAKVFLQRFVLLLLEVTDLNTREVETVNKAELKFSISDDELNTLRQFAKEGNIKSIPLRRLDHIFASIFVKPFFSLPTFENIVNKFPSFNFQQFQIGSFFLSAVLPMIWFLSILSLTRNIAKSFLWLLPVTFLTSYVTTASQMFEEAQVKQYEAMKQYSDFPSDCGVSSNIIWSFIFKTEDCSKFLRVHHVDPTLGITPVKVLTKMFGETVAELMGFFGSGTFGFFGMFEEMSFISRMFFLPLACLLLYAVFVLVCLTLTSGSIRLPYFMGSLNFSNSNRSTSTSSASNAPHVSAAPQRVDPLASNITFNFNQVPDSTHELLRSISHVLNPSLLTTSSQSDSQPSPALTSHGAIEDPLAGGDDYRGGSSSSGSNNRPQSRPNPSVGLKKQFAHIESKYKSGHKSSSKYTRVRHMSL